MTRRDSVRDRQTGRLAEPDPSTYPRNNASTYTRTNTCTYTSTYTRTLHLEVATKKAAGYRCLEP